MLPFITSLRTPYEFLLTEFLHEWMIIIATWMAKQKFTLKVNDISEIESVHESLASLFKFIDRLISNFVNYLSLIHFISFLKISDRLAQRATDSSWKVLNADENQRQADWRAIAKEGSKIPFKGNFGFALIFDEQSSKQNRLQK